MATKPIPPRRQGETDARWLARIIAGFPARLPISGRLGGDHRAHWIGWLSEYDGSGAYGRSDQAPRTLRAIYNRFNAASALVYLAEGLGLRRDLLLQAAAVPGMHMSAPRVAGQVRKILPFDLIEQALRVVPEKPTRRR